jgi:hypothetical protein
VGYRKNDYSIPDSVEGGEIMGEALITRRGGSGRAMTLAKSSSLNGNFKPDYSKYDYIVAYRYTAGILVYSGVFFVTGINTVYNLDSGALVTDSEVEATSSDIAVNPPYSGTTNAQRFIIGVTKGAIKPGIL